MTKISTKLIVGLCAIGMFLSTSTGIGCSKSEEEVLKERAATVINAKMETQLLISKIRAASSFEELEPLEKELKQFPKPKTEKELLKRTMILDEITKKYAELTAKKNMP